MSLRRLGALSLLTCVLGCAHGTVRAISPTPTDGVLGPIGSVGVTLGPDLPESRRAAYAKHQGEDVIRTAISEAFTARGGWDPASGQALQVTVKILRLRSTTNAFLAGTFAGIDMLEGEAELRRGDGVTALYAFKLSGAEDQYFKFSAGARFRSLARCLGRELAGFILPAPGG